MCIVSMLVDYPHRIPPNYPSKTAPWRTWDSEKWERYKKLLEDAKILDDLTGQPDCPTEEKIKLLKEMQDYFDKKFAELEKRLTK